MGAAAQLAIQTSRVLSCCSFSDLCAPQSVDHLDISRLAYRLTECSDTDALRPADATCVSYLTTMLGSVTRVIATRHRLLLQGKRCLWHSLCSRHAKELLKGHASSLLDCQEKSDGVVIRTACRYEAGGLLAQHSSLNPQFVWYKAFSTMQPCWHPSLHCAPSGLADSPSLGKLLSTGYVRACAARVETTMPWPRIRAPNPSEARGLRIAARKLAL